MSLCRNQVKADYLMSIESSDGLMEEIGAQALATGAYQVPETVLQAVDSVTKNQVVMVSAHKFLFLSHPHSFYSLFRQRHITV